MPNRNRALAAAALACLAVSPLLALAAPPPHSQRRLPPIPPPIQRRLEQVLTESANASHVMGVQATVRVPGRAPWSGVAGLNRPGDPMRPELMIGTGSLSKMYTAVAALLLVDRGRVSLDESIGRWFAGVPNVDPTVTVRQLLNHTSGLADYGTNPDFGRAIRADVNRRWRPEEILAYVGPPTSRPGERFLSSNTNRLLLGLIVERETGAPLAEFLKSEIFLHSPSSWCMEDGATPPLLATHWFPDATGQLVDANPLIFVPSISTARREIHASADDIASFTERVFAGDLISEYLRTQMLTTVPSDGKVPGETGSGLGIRAYQQLDGLDRPTFGHTGANSNNRSYLLFDPITQVSVAVTMNQGDGHGDSHFALAPALMKAAIEFVERH